MWPHKVNYRAYTLSLMLDRLGSMGEGKYSLHKINPESLVKFSDALEKALDEDYAVRVLDENPKRIVYDVAKAQENDAPISICRVVKQEVPGGEEWAGTCKDENDKHISIVKKWEKEGRKLGPWKEVGIHFKEMMDSLRTKGPKKFKKNLMHKKFPKLTRPPQVKKPLGDPKIIVNEE